MMESIEKARAAIAKDVCTNANLADAFGLDDNAMLGTTLPAVFDAIEAEIAEKYMELPLDAEGVPISIGDRMESFDCPYQDYVRFAVCGYTSELPEGEGRLMVVGNDADWYGETIRHINRHTLEDVLQSAGVSVAAIDDVAAEIRELLGVIGE